MNWGKGLALAMGAFMFFILFMVFTLMSKNTDLVAADYYQQEIDYEQEIKAVNNAQQMEEKVSISQNESFVVVKFPNEEAISDMEIKLMRPDNDKEDQNILSEDSKTVLIDRKKLRKGQYDLKVMFNIGDKSYLHKEELTVK